jgi:hypothetical protein
MVNTFNIALMHSKTATLRRRADMAEVNQENKPEICRCQQASSN